MENNTVVIDDTKMHVTLLNSTKIKSSDTEMYANLLRKLNSQLLDTRGFRGLDVVHRDQGRFAEFLILVRFESEESLNHWKTSKSRLEAIAELDRLAVAPAVRQEQFGHDLWFNSIVHAEIGTFEPPFWKRWALSIVAVYPPLLILAALAGIFLKFLPPYLSMLTVVVALTGILTAFVMPLLTRLAQGWLMKEKSLKSR